MLDPDMVSVAGSSSDQDANHGNGSFNYSPESVQPGPSRYAENSFDAGWDRSTSLTPPPQSGISVKTPVFPRMNDNTLRLLKEVFAAYCSLPEAGHPPIEAQGDVDQLFMNLPTWHRLCSECRLVEGPLTAGKLELLFYDMAYSQSRGGVALPFDDFARALSQVSLPTAHEGASRVCVCVCARARARTCVCEMAYSFVRGWSEGPPLVDRGNALSAWGRLSPGDVPPNARRGHSPWTAWLMRVVLTLSDALRGSTERWQRPRNGQIEFYVPQQTHAHSPTHLR